MSPSPAPHTAADPSTSVSRAAESFGPSRRVSATHTLRSVRTARTAVTSPGRRSTGSVRASQRENDDDGEYEDEGEEEVDEGASHVFAVIQHARRVSAADTLGQLRNGHDARELASGHIGASGIDGADVQTAPPVPHRPELDGAVAEKEVEVRQEYHDRNDHHDRLGTSIDLDDMGVMQMQWAMPPDRSGIFASPPSSSPLSAKLKSMSRGRARDTFGFPSWTTGAHGESTPVRPKLASSESPFSGSLSHDRDQSGTRQENRPPTSPVPRLRAAAQRTADVPKDVDEDGTSVAHHRASASIHRSMHRTRIPLPGYGYGEEAASLTSAPMRQAEQRRGRGAGEQEAYGKGDDEDESEPSTGISSTFSGAASFQRKAAERAERRRLERVKSAKSNKSGKSSRSDTSTKALFDGHSGFLSFRSRLGVTSREADGWTDIPSSSFSDARPTTTSAATVVSSNTDTPSSDSKRTNGRRSLKIVARRARESRWTVKPAERDKGGESCRSDHEEEHEHDQVGLLMYDGSTGYASREAGHEAKNGQKGEGKRLSKLALSTVPNQFDAEVTSKSQRDQRGDGETDGDEKEEVMDLGLLVGRAAVLERILNAGKRISNTSLHHTTHRPYTPSRFSRSSLAQSFNSALGSAFGLGSQQAFAAYSGRSSASALASASASAGDISSSSHPYTPFGDLPPTPRVPDHLLHLLHKHRQAGGARGGDRDRHRSSGFSAALARSGSMRSNVSARTRRTARTWKSATTTRTGRSGGAESGHTARARRHVGRAMMRLTGEAGWADDRRGGAGGTGGASGDMRAGGEGDWQEIGEEDDEGARYPARGDAYAAVEGERKRLAKRVKGDTDGWGSFPDIAEGAGRRSGVFDRRSSGAGVTFMPFADTSAGDAAARSKRREEEDKARSHTTFLIPAKLRHVGIGTAKPDQDGDIGQRDRPSHHSATGVGPRDNAQAQAHPVGHRPHTTMIPSCTSTELIIDQSRDITALARSVGGRGLMAPPQCVDDYVIESATRRLTSYEPKGARYPQHAGQNRTRGGEDRARTVSRHTYGTYSEKGHHIERSLGDINEHEQDYDLGSKTRPEARQGWRGWMRKRRMWLIVGTGVVLAGLLMLVGILVGVLTKT